jgi:DNA-binding transcriptional MerR regulator
MELSGDADRVAVATFRHGLILDLPTMGKSSVFSIRVFTISAFAGLTGVSAKKLRHYDGIGLFRPAWVDPASHYRYYLASQIPELQRIVALRDLGLSLSTIAGLNQDGSTLREALARRRADLIAEREALDRRLAALDIRVDQTVDRDVVVRRRPAGMWASLRRRLHPGNDLGDWFFELEDHVRTSGARAPRPPVAIDHGASGTGRSVEILVPVTRAVAESGDIRFVRTPPASVASAIERGAYPNLAGAGDWARRWAQTTGYTVDGPTWVVYLRFSAEPELMVPDGFLTDDQSEYVTEIQVPVRTAAI